MSSSEIESHVDDHVRRISGLSTEFGDGDDEEKKVDGSKDDEKRDEEKQDDDETITSADIITKPSPENALHTDSPITYHYLTFSTPLPQPSTTILPSKTTPPPPEPDLNKFISPFEWPESRKNFIIWLSCLATLITAYTAGSYSPASAQMAAEWDVSDTAIVVGITTFCSGFAIAPMVLAPFSEINGRYPVFVGAGILFLICQICCAITQSYAGMILARFFVGCGSSVFSTMVGGVVADLYHAKGRNTPMALFSGAALFGTGLGPLVSGFIAQYTSWRWVFWVQVITCGCLIAAIIVCFRETRGSILLSRKAMALNKWYESREKAGYYGFDISSSPSPDDPEMEKPSAIMSQRLRWKVKSDEDRESIAKMIGISVYRPFHLLVTEPVVFFFSLWVSFAWAVLYLTFGSIPLVFETSHNFTLSQSTSIFVFMILGALLSTPLSIYQDRLLFSLINRLSEENFLRKTLNPISPEARLYCTCLLSPLLPLALILFGVFSSPNIPWPLPGICVTLATMGIYTIYLSTFNYLADAYHRYASSALAAQSFCRNILGGVFPLVTVQMFNGLGFTGAACLLGSVAGVLAVVPWVLVGYGEGIRGRSRFAREIM